MTEVCSPDPSSTVASTKRSASGWGLISVTSPTTIVSGSQAKPDTLASSRSGLSGSALPTYFSPSTSRPAKVKTRVSSSGDRVTST